MTKPNNPRRYFPRGTTAADKLRFRVNSNGCWIFIGSKTTKGYGKVYDEEGKNRQAHRVAFEAWGAPFWNGVMICHTCDVRDCINPDHLYVGDAKSNMADMRRRGRYPLGEDHGSTRLTTAEVVQIKMDLAAGFKLQREIAAEYGVSPTAIGDIKRGRTWAHVHG